jgi:hypothetical protein
MSSFLKPIANRQPLKAFYWLIPLLLLATYLGARGLNADALWLDEYYSMLDAGGAHLGPLSPADIWNRVAERNPWNAPGYYIILSAWGSLVGWTAYAGRSLSLFIGLLAICWTYRLGRDLSRSQLVGLSAAVVLGTSAFFIDYLHELRAYTFHTLFASIAVWSYWRIISPPHSYGEGTTGRGRLLQLLFILSLIGLLYAHYFAALTMIALAIYQLLFVPKTREWWRVVILMGIASLVFLPWFGIVVSALGVAQEATGRRDVAMSPTLTIQTLLYAFSNASVALLILVGGIGFNLRQHFVRLLMVWIITVVALALLVNFLVPGVLIHIRYLINLWPALAVLMGLGIARLARLGISPVIILFIWIGAGLWNTLTPAFVSQLPGAEPKMSAALIQQTLETLSSRAHDDDVVMFRVAPPARSWLTAPVLDFYLHDTLYTHIQAEEIPAKQENDEFFNVAREMVEDAPYVWVLSMPGMPFSWRTDEFLRAVETEHVLCGTVFTVPDASMNLYARVPAYDSDDLDARFGETVGFTLLEPLSEKITGDLNVVAGWSVSRDVSADTYSVGLHVKDSNGSLVAQLDYGLPLGQATCRIDTVPVTDLAPGEYTLNVLVYNWQTGERLLALKDDNQRDDVLLRNFRIE